MAGYYLVYVVSIKGDSLERSPGPIGITDRLEGTLAEKIETVRKVFNLTLVQTARLVPIGKAEKARIEKLIEREKEKGRTVSIGLAMHLIADKRAVREAKRKQKKIDAVHVIPV
jgi:hypothetical protein